MEYSTTNRGFDYIEFKDLYDKACSIQKSSLADQDCIWIGINDPEPKILASHIIENGTGWANYPIPENVQINTRMHLTQDQAKELIEVLQRFVDTGDIV